MLRMKALLLDRRGIGNVGLIMILAIVLVVAGVVLEYGRVLNIRNNVEKELSRAVNVSIKAAMQDEFRRDSISLLDETLALATLRDYLITDMDLNASCQRIVDGSVVYRLDMGSQSVQADPPRMEVAGILIIPVSVFRDLLGEGLAFRIPFRIASRNQRLDE